jgi:hypothetical protein
MKKNLIIIFIAVVATFSLQAQNCKYLEEGQASPKAQLSELEWLGGHWQGEGFGGKIEEIWSHEMGGAMMGSFRMIMKEEVSFYELMTISKEGNSILLRIKHFDKNLKGWEEKDESVEFKLVEITSTAVYFEGLTMEKVSDDLLNIYVMIDHDGKKEEAKFEYKRLN